MTAPLDIKPKNFIKKWAFFIMPMMILLFAPLILATTLDLWSRLIVILLLGWFLPGMLLVAHWRLPNLDCLSAGLLASGLGICWMILVVLFLYWLPGGISLWQLVGAYEIGALGLLVALWWHPPLPFATTVSSGWGLILFLLLIAAPLRLPGLAYHEFHFDEVLVLTRAKEAIKGQEDAFARHAKGPGELAIATVIYRGLGTINEGLGRFPFGIASILSVLATAWLGYRLFSPSVGFWAGVLLSVNGFALGLSRIVQYQPIILLLSALVLLTAWEFAQRGNARWLAVTGVLSTFGIIMHYEFGLQAPVLLFLAWRGWQKNSNKRSILKVLLLVGIPSVLLVAATYLPILLHPYFERHLYTYLSQRMGESSGLHFNGLFFIEMATFYNSSYFLMGLIVLMLAGLIMGWYRTRAHTFLLGLWFAPFFIFYFFIVRFPGTHFYLMMESCSLLAALPLAALVGPFQTKTTQWRANPPSAYLRTALLSALIGWLAISIGYLYLIFFRQAPEYVINYEQARIPFYWAPYEKNIPKEPRFGFPIFEGWKTLGVLTEWNYLGKTYASNERSRHLRWYLAGFERVDFEDHPDFIFVSQHQQQPVPSFNESKLEGYQRVGEIRVRGEARIVLYANQPLAVPYVAYDAEHFTNPFDTLVPPFDEWPTPVPALSEFALDENITLESATILDRNLQQGDTLHLRLIWRPAQQVEQNYKVFVHVGRDEGGQPLTQWDGHPGLNTIRSSQWVAGKPFKDHILLTIPSEMPSGEHQIVVGLYDETSGQRVGGQAIAIGTIIVR